ncbi:MAG: hypothetical protein PF487_05970, partial [Bacteroidales bacterium]|nr:hypothetical protein [Bacteroidales bacterium]
MLRKRILYLFIFSIIILSSNTSSCQNPTYKHYTIKNGLPSSETYHVFQDSKGYIWFATNMGVSRFDGYEFKNFDVQDGLVDNTV